MTLTEFLLARIAEDEERARTLYPFAMTGERWKHYPEDAYNEVQAITLAYVRRMLAECEAKRRIVEEALGILGPEPGDDPYAEFFELDDGQVRAYGVTLRALAAVYADHPDYDETWRP